MTTQRRPMNRKGGIQVRTITPEEEFLSRNQGKVTTRTPFHNMDGEAEIDHTRPGVVLMWKPGADGRYVPRNVSETSKGLNLDNGWLIACPDCGTNHEASPLPVSDPNACPARPPVAVRLCPVCSKRIPDNMGFAMKGIEDDEVDPNVIRDESYENSTPESRTRVQLNVHLWTRHPRQAQMMNIDPLPVAYREMVDNVRPV